MTNSQLSQTSQQHVFSDALLSKSQASISEAKTFENKHKKDSAYKVALNQALDSITGLCADIGKTNASAPVSVNSGPISPMGTLPESHIHQAKPNTVDEATIGSSHESLHYIIHHDPIFMAIMKVLMTGGDSVLHNLAATLAKLNKVKEKTQKVTMLIEKLQNLLTDISNLGPMPNPKNNIAGYNAWIAKAKDYTDRVAKVQAHLEKVLNRKGVIKALGGKDSELYQAMQKIPNDFDGTLSEADGEKGDTFAQLADEFKTNPDGAAGVFNKFQGEINNESGGPTGKGATGLFSDLSNGMTSLNSQSSAQQAQLNLQTQKVSADSKLFSSALSIYRGMIPSMTTYSGS